MNTTGSPQRNESKKFSWLIFAVLAGYFTTYLIYFSAWPIDDSFIAMRVARNLAFFGKPYFNIDDPVLGTSCHTWILLLSACFSFIGAKLPAVIALEIMAVLALLYFCAEILREKFSRPTSLLLAFALIHLTALQFAALLRETTLVLLFFCLAILAVRKKKYFSAGLFSALAAFTRNEFVLFALLLLFFHRRIARFWFGQAAAAVPLTAFLLFFYRTVIPQPLFAKALFAAIAPAEKALQMLIPSLQVIDETQRKAFFMAPRSAFHLGFNLAAPTLLVAAGVFFLWRRRDNNSLYASVAAFPFLLAACYLRNSAWIPIWYWPHVVFPLLLWGLLQYRQVFWLALAFLATGIGRIPQQAADFYALVSRHPEQRSLAPFTERTLQYLELGRQLAELPLDCRSVYATEIGALGWNFPYSITDGLGLVSSRTFADLRNMPPSASVIKLNTLLPLLNTDPPCLIVSLPTFVKSQGAEEAVQSRYRILSRTALTLPFLGDQEILVWQRNL